MIVIAVRVIETREMVGVFWAADKATLWDCVDEVADPGLCEFLRLPSGGLHAGTNAPRIPEQFEEGDSYEFTLAPSDDIGEALDGGRKWRAFDAAEVGVGLIARLFAKG